MFPQILITIKTSQLQSAWDSSGEQESLLPDSYITREDLMVMLLRAMAITGYEVELAGEEILTSVKTAQRSNYARPAAACLVKSGIINGINGSIA